MSIPPSFVPLGQYLMSVAFYDFYNKKYHEYFMVYFRGDIVAKT